MTFYVKMQVMDLHLYINLTLAKVFFKYFASKNQLLGFYISGALVENGLNKPINN